MKAEKILINYGGKYEEFEYHGELSLHKLIEGLEVKEKNKYTGQTIAKKVIGYEVNLVSKLVKCFF